MDKGNQARSRIVENCRLCGGALGPAALSLGDQPISNRLPRAAEKAPCYPLEIALCTVCGLPQLLHHLDADTHFHDDYTYVSGASRTWVKHCEEYARDVSTKYGVCGNDLIVEAGSNDGTLILALRKAGFRALGVEPSKNVADIAIKHSAPTVSAFFNDETAARIRDEHGPAKMVIGNNVLAHVPDTNGFLRAARDLIVDDGLLCFEFPYFTNIVDKMHFDTVYHEHYTYLGVGPLAHWARHNGMVVTGAEKQETHGGTLRVLLKHGDESEMPSEITEMIEKEFDYRDIQVWHNLSDRLSRWRDRFREAIADRRSRGYKIVGYAAASKATVLLNYVGLSSDEIAYCCDASPLKQNRFIPGANVPVVPPDRLKTDRPDTIVVFAWNIIDELRGVVSAAIDAPVEMINPFPNIEAMTVQPKGGNE